MPQSLTRGSAPQNRILAALTDTDRDALLAEARAVQLAPGYVFAVPGAVMRSVYFPETGVLSMVAEMTTGHHVAVGVIGRDGAVGLDALGGTLEYQYRVVTLAESRGFAVPVKRVAQTFDASSAARRVLIRYLACRIDALTTTAACNRVHSHRQRLALWLAVAGDAAGQRALAVTHEMLAQLVGGPRHAVTVALRELAKKAAIRHRRGRLELIGRSALVKEACECYTAHSRLVRAVR